MKNFQIIHNTMCVLLLLCAYCCYCVRTAVTMRVLLLLCAYCCYCVRTAVTVCVLLLLCAYCCYYVCTAVTVCVLLFFTLDVGLLAISQYAEGPATGHLDTGFSWFPCVYKQMLRWFPRFQVATTCFSYSPPDLNLSVTNFIFCIHVK